MKLRKIISKSLAIGLLFNSISTSFAGVLSEDGRYEAFEGNNITIDNILEEDEADVEIEGNTMINLVTLPSTTERRIEVTREKANILADFKNRNNIKPNTVYTYIVDVEVLDATPNFKTSVNFDYIDSNSNHIYHPSVSNPIIGAGKQTFKTTFTTGNNVSRFNNLFVIANTSDGNTSSGVQKVTNMMLLEGDYSDSYATYFEGITSVGEKIDGTSELEIKYNNKNLLNLLDLRKTEKTNVQVTELEANSLKLIVSPNNTTSYASVYFDGMRFIPGVRYRITGRCEIVKGSGIRPMFSIRDISHDKYLTNGYHDANGNIDETFVANNYRHRVEFFSNNTAQVVSDVEIIFKDLQITVDTSGLEYESYQSNSINIYLKEPLRALPNGVKDRIIKRNGQWVVERNCGEIILNGSEQWLSSSINTPTRKTITFYSNIIGKSVEDMIHNEMPNIKSDTFIVNSWDAMGISDIESVSISGTEDVGVTVNKVKLDSIDIDGFKKWLSENPIKVIYKLKTPTYEPLNIDPTINLYLDTTHISNDSTIPANMKVTVDRTINRATEAIELAQENPTVDNISKARMWINLLKESTNKDELNNQVNDITEIKDLTINKKTTTSNVDVYIKSQNGLSMTLSTNSIIFDEFGGTEDMEKLNAVDVTIDSSLPYRLNSYLMSEIKNEGGTNIIPKELFNIKINGENDYKAFSRLNEKLVLKEDCSKGENRYGIDLILKGSLTHEADVYKTTIKFEAEQK